MHRYTLAVLDDSFDYINHFLVYFKNKKGLPFETIGFTGRTMLEDYLAASKIDILLLSRDLYNRYQMEIIKESEEDTRSGLIQGSDNVKEIVILGEQQDMNASPKCINMYRPMRLIETDLILAVRDLASREELTFGRRAEVYGIYSLEAGSDPFALARNLACDCEALSRTLYIDLDTFSGLSLRLHIPTTENMSDLIFYYRSDMEMFRSRIREALYSYESMDVLPAPVCLKDLDEITASGWDDFLRCISTECGYDRIFLNITDSCRDMTGIFSVCSYIYVFGYGLINWHEGNDLDGVHSELISSAAARAKAFRNYFAAKGRTDIIDRFRHAGWEDHYAFN